MLGGNGEPETGANTLGGKGGSTNGTVRTTRLLRRALEQHWQVPQELRAAAIAHLTEVLRDRNASARTKTAAARASIAVTRATSESLRLCVHMREVLAIEERLDELEQRAKQEAPSWYRSG
jgi:hypothetical protein